MSKPNAERKSGKPVSSHLSDEIRQVSDNLKGPIANLIAGSVESSLEVVGTVTAGVGRIVGTFVDEGARIGERVRRGIEAAGE